MPGKYTPEMIDIKIGYCSSFDTDFAHKVMAHAAAEMTTGHAGDFDRALEKHDREVKSQALRDAAVDLASDGMQQFDPVPAWAIQRLKQATTEEDKP